MALNEIHSLQPSVDFLLVERSHLRNKYLTRLKALDAAIVGLGGYAEADEKMPKTTTKKTFEGAILKILNDGKPRTSAVLHRAYNKAHEKKFDDKNFSCRLSMVCGKKTPQIKFAEVNGRNYFGWVGWFVGNNFKLKYIQAIEEGEEEK